MLDNVRDCQIWYILTAISENSVKRFLKIPPMPWAALQIANELCYQLAVN